jgi:hypothetical protein
MYLYVTCYIKWGTVQFLSNESQLAHTASVHDVFLFRLRIYIKIKEQT